MATSKVPAARLRRASFLVLTSLAATLLAAPTVFAEDFVSIVSVEEQWELVVAEADPDRDAPQVTTVLAPLGNLEGLYAAFELNHRSQPTYAGGGLQLQVWGGGDQPLATRQQKDSENLSHANETVTWTQTMELQDGQLTFRVVDGNSTSWGQFGGPLSATVATTLSNLNSYDPLVAVNNSGVGYASNRVSSLKLKKVTVKLSSGQTLEDDTVKVAYPKD